MLAVRNLLTSIKFFTNFAGADRIAEARSWATREGQQLSRSALLCKDTFRKRLLDALSWLVETSQLSIVVKNVANCRCLVDMYISPIAGA